MRSSARLQSRIGGARSELDELDGVIGAVARKAGVPSNVGELARVLERLRPVFARETHAIRARLDRLFGDGVEDPSSTLLELCWREFESVRRDLDGVSDSVLGTAQGALARAAALDGGLCALSDSLLDELAGRSGISWERITIPVAREHTDNRTWVVGLRLPATVWSLPLMAHELGHFAATRLEDRFGGRPAVELLDVARFAPTLPDDQRTQAKRLLKHPVAHELFADVFATYALGPAFAACLVWRSTPDRPWEPRGDHPAWAWRVRAALRSLGSDPTSRWVRGKVNDLWDEPDRRVTSASASIEEAGAILDTFTDCATALLRSSAPLGRFEVTDATVDAEQRLVRGERRPPGTDIATILNAAWIHRLRSGWTEDSTLADRAHAWCLECVGA